MTRPPDPPRQPQLPVFPEVSLGDYLPAESKRRPVKEPPLPAPAAIVAIESALDRIEQTIDQENAALESHQPTDLEDLNRRKSRSLLEITRLARALPAGAGGGLGERLGRLRDKLTHNHAVLARHLAAVREIADLMVGAIDEAESDGTYGMSTRRRETAR